MEKKAMFIPLKHSNDEFSKALHEIIYSSLINNGIDKAVEVKVIIKPRNL